MSGQRAGRSRRAAGPLIGGAITTAISSRAAFVFQALVIVLIVLLARGITDPRPAEPGRRLDTVGAILSAVGLMLTPSVNVVQSAFPRPAAGTDLRAFAKRLQPGIIVRHRDRGHHPGSRLHGLIGLGAAIPLPRIKPGSPAAADVAAG